MVFFLRAALDLCRFFDSLYRIDSLPTVGLQEVPAPRKRI